MIEEIYNFRNITLLRHHPNCRPCHYAGSLNICTFSRGGRCTHNTYAGNDNITEAEQDDK